MKVNVRWWGLLLVCLALPVNAQNATPADRADSGSTESVTAPGGTPAGTPAPAPTPVLAPPPSPSPEPLATKADVDARLDRLYGAHQPYADFLAALQKASAANDRQAIANMVHYPFSTLLAARRKVLKTPKAFLARYDDIMTPKVRAAIAAQTYETLFSNSNGLMIGSGQVWFTGKCVDATCAKPPRIGISAINH
jgi:hypothetical protein